MSASLVGSEMCIRDRLLARVPTPARSGPNCGSISGAAISWAISLRRASVSYTHLTLPTICSV
eukprot:3485277-Alexandrium_andersonii.AAC.1